MSWQNASMGTSAKALRLDTAAAIEGDDVATSLVVHACGEHWSAQIVLTRLWRMIDVPVGGSAGEDWRAALCALRVLEAVVGAWPELRPQVAKRTPLLRRLAATAPFALPPGTRPAPVPIPASRVRHLRQFDVKDTPPKGANFSARAAVRERAERVLELLKLPAEVPTAVPTPTVGALHHPALRR